jgi:hypothetical protein
MCRVLVWAGIFHLANGLWMLGNRNFYSPVFNTKQTSDSITSSDSFLTIEHNLSEFTPFLARLTV